MSEYHWQSETRKKIKELEKENAALKLKLAEVINKNGELIEKCKNCEKTKLPK